MNTNKKCPNCRAEMVESVVEHRYTECGLDSVVLANVPVFSCPACGERILRIPAIDGLHRVIAIAVSRKASRLTPAEVRFLRKYLGLSNRDFARVMGVTPEQSSRWTTTEPIGTSAERVLRLLVERIEPADEYPIGWLQQISDERDVVEPIWLRERHARWERIPDGELERAAPPA
jgi:putative zinc finger/helix-turn-helix YgiT family protein